MTAPRRPSRTKAVNHFVTLIDIIDDQARFMLRTRGGDPSVQKLDRWAVKIREDIEKVANAYLRVFDAIDTVIDGPPTPRVLSRR